MPAIMQTFPLYYFLPDIQYVKAKIMRVMQGQLFADPVTNFPSFHPPFYHLLLSFMVRAGIDLDRALVLIAAMNMILTIVLAYLVIKNMWDRETALLTAAMIPFLLNYMGPGYPFLATAFYFSVPIFLTGLWLYTMPSNNWQLACGTGLLWGTAFLISPVYLFLVGFLAAYELFLRKNVAKSGLTAGVFLLVIIPFYVQAYTLYGIGMEGTSAFAVWRGVPDALWFKTTIMYFISPNSEHLSFWQFIPIVLILAMGIGALWRFGSHRPLLAVAALAYLFTMYHFNKQYASRILFFYSIFWMAGAVHFIKARAKPRLWAYVLIVPLILYGITDHLVTTTRLFSAQEQNVKADKQAAALLTPILKKIIGPQDRIFATEKTYRMSIMPYIPVFGLMAYKSGEYFQLGSTVAKEMRSDYDELLAATQVDVVEFFCRKYNIQAAVAGDIKEMYSPVFQTIDQNWPLIYKDDHFRVYRRPRKNFE